MQFPDEETRLIQDHQVSGLGWYSAVTATKLRAPSRGLYLSTLSALERGGSLPHCDFSSFPSFLQVFAEHLLCAGPTDGSVLMRMAFQGGKEEDSPPAKQMTLRPQGLRALHPSLARPCTLFCICDFVLFFLNSPTSTHKFHVLISFMAL